MVAVVQPTGPVHVGILATPEGIEQPLHKATFSHIRADDVSFCPRSVGWAFGRRLRLSTCIPFRDAGIRSRCQATETNAVP